MALRDWFKWGGSARVEPRASYQDNGPGILISTPQQLEEALRSGVLSGSGVNVSPNTAMTVAAVYACVRIRCGVVANMPIHVKRRVDERTREDASDHPLWQVLRRRPNRWQTPSQFKRMMEAHLLLRGNAYALIVRSRGAVMELLPLHPDRVDCKQNDDLSLTYEYTRVDGRRVTFSQAEVFHLVGLSLDGVHGVSVLTYARETIGESIAMTDHGAAMFRNGARPSGVLSHPGKIGKPGVDLLRDSLEQFRSGAERDSKVMILEEGMKFESMAMTSVDAQWIESRRFTRTDIAMFFGVPPHMIGDTEKSTSWGTGIEQQTQGFVTFSAEDDLTTWEETINRDLVAADESDIYARFNRASLVKGDIKTRWEAYAAGRRMQVFSANDVRAFEDMNPIEGGDVYENPEINTTNKGAANEPPPTP